MEQFFPHGKTLKLMPGNNFTLRSIPFPNEEKIGTTKYQRAARLIVRLNISEVIIIILTIWHGY